VPTREEIARDQLVGQVVGFGLGIVASIVAAIIYTGWQRWRAPKQPQT
jgi:hypothetical protein